MNQKIKDRIEALKKEEEYYLYHIKNFRYNSRKKSYLKYKLLKVRTELNSLTLEMKNEY